MRRNVPTVRPRVAIPVPLPRPKPLPTDTMVKTMRVNMTKEGGVLVRQGIVAHARTKTSRPCATYTPQWYDDGWHRAPRNGGAMDIRNRMRCAPTRHRHTTAACRACTSASPDVSGASPQRQAAIWWRTPQGATSARLWLLTAPRGPISIARAPSTLIASPASGIQCWRLTLLGRIGPCSPQQSCAGRGFNLSLLPQGPVLLPAGSPLRQVTPSGALARVTASPSVQSRHRGRPAGTR